MARPHDAVLGDRPELDGWVEVDAHPQARTEPGPLVYRFDAPLFFLNTERFRARVLEALDANPGREDWLVLDFEGIGGLDASALDGLTELLEQLVPSEVQVVAVARANEDVVRRLRRIGLVGPGGPLALYPTIDAAVRDFRRARGAADRDPGTTGASGAT
jgi:sulfate permease, SulP family